MTAAPSAPSRASTTAVKEKTENALTAAPPLSATKAEGKAKAALARAAAAALKSANNMARNASAAVSGTPASSSTPVNGKTQNVPATAASSPASVKANSKNAPATSTPSKKQAAKSAAQLHSARFEKLTLRSIWKGRNQDSTIFASLDIEFNHEKQLVYELGLASNPAHPATANSRTSARHIIVDGTAKTRSRDMRLFPFGPHSMLIIKMSSCPSSTNTFPILSSNTTRWLSAVKASGRT